MPVSVPRLSLLDVVVALTAVVAAGLSDDGSGRRPALAVAVLGAGWMAGLALRTVAPLVMAVWVSVGLVAYVLATDAGPMPLWAFVTALWATFSVGSQLTGGRRLAAGAVLVAAVAAAGVVTSRDDFADRWVSPMVIVVAPMLAGALLRTSREQTAEVRRTTVALAEEREAHARDAAAAERNRVARELHDVISHSVSVMVVQAGAADQLLPPDSPARPQVQAVRETGRQALAELRHQLGVLREAPDTRPVAVPSLGDLGRLADDAGAEYDPGELGEVPPGAALTAYRVAQEALTNARKHAAGGAVRVRTARRGDDLVVEVVNGPGRILPDTPGSGSGLQGMRERVDLYAGRLETGPTTERGWRVCAVLPVGPS